MSWECFFIVPTQQAEQTLRRYSPYEKDLVCPAHGIYGHNATYRMENTVLENDKETSLDDWDHHDTHWPETCLCGYEFGDKDLWQRNLNRLYTRSNGKDLFTLRTAPIGSMRFLPWFTEKGKPSAETLSSPTYRNYLSKYYWEDWYGIREPIGIRVPGQLAEWCVDSTANNGPGWRVTGDPPKLTATPSILTRNYHGFLTDGILTDDAESRQYNDKGLLQ